MNETLKVGALVLQRLSGSTVVEHGQELKHHFIIKASSASWLLQVIGMKKEQETYGRMPTEETCVAFERHYLAAYVPI